MIRYVLFGLTLLFALLGRLIHVVYFPEWSEPQALINLWPIWLLAMVSFVAALLVTDRIKT